MNRSPSLIAIKLVPYVSQRSHYVSSSGCLNHYSDKQMTATTSSLALLFKAMYGTDSFTTMNDSKLKCIEELQAIPRLFHNTMTKPSLNLFKTRQNAHNSSENRL